MSHFASQRGYPYAGHHGAAASTSSAAGASTINQKAALASAYQELGKELSSSKLKIVGNYTLQRPIGEGTFGKVRLAHHRLTNTRVAIKQIPKAHSASLTREIHHHRRLHHPNVMQLYEVIATEQYIWMVSELCAGGELYDYLVENECLPEPEARRIFGQLCLAVAYVHSKGIVHRDLKLENILLDERCNVKLGDFGFTREFERNRLMHTFCGTTGYASPEMLAGKKYTGEQVDIWSLGVILYALLCGALPFDDDDESVMKQKILQGDLEIPDCLSEEARSLITNILQQDPAQRPSIHQILQHPWFTKIMAQSPMSTVEEDDSAADYFTSRASDFVSASNNPPAAAPAISVLEAAAIPAPLSSPIPPSSHDSLPLHQHHPSASGTSDLSYHSARSDSESSGRRSSNTDLTDPTTADSLSRTDDALDPIDIASASRLTAAPAAAPAVPSSHPDKQAISIHRNESQTTIRRLGSNGSDASLSTVARPAAIRSTTSSLPTHHELPSTSPAELDADTGDAYVPLYQSVPLAKRGSQSSSRGHHRTPSRTKRRSLSSGGLSDHHPPLLGRKPVDYVSQLSNLQPATFSSAVEQNLLHQLSSLGMDVGQMVHSVVNDACDASGAMWWMLLRKAKDRTIDMLPSSPSVSNHAYTPVEQPLSCPAADTSNAKGLGLEPIAVDMHRPPVPVKDPARSSEDRSRAMDKGRASLTASRSENSGLAEPSNRRLQTVVSHEELDCAAAPPLQSSASEALIGAASLSMHPSPSDVLRSLPTSPAVNTLQDRSLASTPESSSSSRPKSQHRHTTATTSPSKLQQVATSLVGAGSPSSEGTKARRSGQTDRPRSNSLSVKQFAQSVLGTKDKGSATPPPPTPDQVIVAGEALPLERTKSPTLFGRRNTVSNVKDSMVGRLSNPSTPKKAHAETPDKPRRSSGKRSIETDLERVKALDRSEDSASGSPSSRSLSTAHPATAPSSDKKGGAVPSASQDSFSTMSATPQGSEKSGTRGKPGSSFMATVRTWLGGANEKPVRKGKQGKKAAAYRGLGIDDGVGAARSPTGTMTTSGSTSTFGGGGTPSRTPSMRRRSAHYAQASASRRGGPRSPHLGSMSRRSSTGSSVHGHLDLPPNSFATSMNRPGNMRRLSAGSITPTGTLYGDYMNEAGVPTSSRHSRPSSSHSLAHSSAAPRSGLHGKAGSTGSTSSAYRSGQAGSGFSAGSGRRHARPAHDGGTTVRRHRTYASSTGSPSRRNSFRHDSRPSSIKSRASSPGRAMGLSEFGVEDADGDAGAAGARRSTRSTPRHSLDQRSVSDVPGHAQHHQVVAQSIFVAHKSRSPYRPPSATASLSASLARAGPGAQGTSKLAGSGASDGAAAASSSSARLPATGTGTWRHSWGRPPPCWAGPVDPPPAEGASGTKGRREEGAPKLRDVFAHRDDDDWTDEDEEPSYSGGLGQMGSTASMAANRTASAASSSPYATRNMAALGSGGVYPSQGAAAGMAPFGSRYAGIRNMFQPPTATGSGFRSNHPVSLSLGNEFAPKLLSATIHESKPAAGGGADDGNDAANGKESPSAGLPAGPPATGAGGTSRINAFHKPVQIIEEEEEDE